ncbi:hypothetical protein SKAU_G00016490 [Synaphobranchus kaupii]|uniref:Ig-like domain-containing protein n=1 Tax=Synaphobranchus kaupii TaxID=118154 RepID=A0A9Q1GC94_SYNKA|nr:hypothetical protein SKAU_G00016490 [Synaphobranchus kaupii]
MPRSTDSMYLSPWISLLLAMCIPVVCSLNSFPENMRVSQKSVNLTCHTKFQGQVTWKHTLEGHVKTVKESRFVNIMGRSLNLTSLDTPNAGEYSCWGEGKELYREYLLLESEEEELEEDEEDYNNDDDDAAKERADSFSCSTQTYSCFFKCYLSAFGFTAARLRYHRVGQAPSPWQNASSAQNNFQFTLPLSYSPYAEESAALEVTAEAVNSRRYLKKTLHFYLRDIVQPDPPQKVKCERAGKTLSVTVEPPDSWAQPFSYFPLEHQIEYINKNNGKTELAASGMIKQRVSMLRARSRDPLIPSAWSKWSPWKNVTN